MRFPIFLLALAVMSVTALSAQPEVSSGEPVPGGDEYVSLTPVSLGRDLLNGKALVGTEYDFGCRVEHSYIDSLSRMATIELRDVTRDQKHLQNRGLMLVLDLSSGRVRWTREVVYPDGSSGVSQQGDFLVYNNGKKTFCLDLMDGRSLWESKYDFWYIDLDSARRIGCGYPSLTGMYAPGTLFGVSLDTGEGLWKRKVLAGYGWDVVNQLDDSTVLIQAAGLHQINLLTGEGWDFEASTVQYVENVKRLLADSPGLKGSVFWKSRMYGAGFVHGLLSKPLVEEEGIFFSSQDKIISLDHDGSLRWERPLPEGVASFSMMLDGDTMVYLIGRGFAFLYGRTVTYGRPFFAAYNKWDGTPIFSEVIDQRKCQIRALKLHRDSMALVTEDCISLRSLQDGRCGRETVIDTSLYGQVVRDVDPEQFFRRDARTGNFSYVVAGLDSWGVFTTKDKLLLLGEQLEIKEALDLDSLYYLCTKRDNLALLRRDSTTYIVDDNGMARMELVSQKTPKWIGDNLYIATRQGIVQVDVSGIFRERYLHPEVRPAGGLACLRRNPMSYNLLND